MDEIENHVSLFVPCLVDVLHPEVAEAVVSVLRGRGLAVDCPGDQTCCGQPAYNAGHRREAARAARHFIEVFAGDRDIVCPSGSCVHMVRNHYPALFRGDPGWERRARTVAGRIYEFTEYLVDILGVTDLGTAFPGTVTYHDSCHLLRGIGVKDQPRALLARVRGLALVEMEESDRCCGFGGAFSVTYPEISTALLADKVDRILATGADAVVGCDISCLMNIEGMLHRRGAAVPALHIARILAGGPSTP